MGRDKKKFRSESAARQYGIMQYGRGNYHIYKVIGGWSVGKR